MNYYILLSYNFRIEDNPIFTKVGDDAKAIVVIYIPEKNVGVKKLAFTKIGWQDLDIQLDECGISTYVWDGTIDVLKTKIKAYQGKSHQYIILEDEPHLLFPKIGKEYKLCKPFFNYHIKHSFVETVDSKKFFENVYDTLNLDFILREPGRSGMKIQNHSHMILKAVLESDVILHYDKKRNFLDAEYTTNLSRWINSGQISIKTIWLAVVEKYGMHKPGAEKFLSELVWRDFAYHQKQFYPDMTWKNLNSSIHIEYENNVKFFDAWKNGKTGFTIIDAAMNQLNETGWMPNRMRMLVASFLTKNLLISWQKGAEYFLEKLIDADPFINALNWQWVAGTGTDYAPYFRIFNPEIQAKRYDENGLYQKKWGSKNKKEKIINLAQSRQKALVSNKKNK